MMRHIDHRSPQDREVEAARQKAELEEDTSEYIVRTRAEDRSLLIRASYLLDKWRPIIWLVGGLLVALGFNFKTPGQSYKELQQEIEAVKAENAKIISERDAFDRHAAAERDTIQGKLDVLIGVRCLDADTRTYLAVAGIDCERYLRPLRQR